MNYSIARRMIGVILAIEALFLLPSLFLSLFDQDGISKYFILTIALMAFFGYMSYRKKTTDLVLAPKDGLFIVSSAWLVVSLFGALPFYFSHYLSYVDAFFEIVFGFTTTGASIIPNIGRISQEFDLMEVGNSLDWRDGDLGFYHQSLTQTGGRGISNF